MRRAPGGFAPGCTASSFWALCQSHLFVLLLGGKHFHILCLLNFPWTEPRGATCATRRCGAALMWLCKLGSLHAASRRISMHAASQSPDSHVWRKTALKSADRKLKTPQRVCSNLSLHVQEEQLLPVLRRPSSILRNEFSIALFHSELRLVFLFPLQFPQSAPSNTEATRASSTCTGQAGACSGASALLLCPTAAKTPLTGACSTPPLVPLALCFVAVEVLLCSLPMLGVLAQEPLPSPPFPSSLLLPWVHQGEGGGTPGLLLQGWQSWCPVGRWLVLGAM